MGALTTPQVLVGGRWLSSLVTWGDLTITHRWPYGCWEATWQIAVKEYQRVAPIIADAPVQIRLGSGSIFTGNLAEPNWATGEMVAVGAAREGETALCLTAAGDTTSTPDLAIDQAVGRGALSWIRRSSLSGAALAAGDTTARLSYVTALLDAWALTVKQRWAVGPDRVVYSAADPTVPSIYVRPGAGVLGVTEATQAARVFGRYIGANNAYATVNVGAGSPEIGVDLTSYGPTNATAATQTITAIRDQLQARTGWTNGLTVTADQVTNPGGVPISLDQIVAGKMMRILGLRDDRGASASTDVVIGETIWNVSAGTVQVNPVGLDGQSLAEVIEAAGGELL